MLKVIVVEDEQLVRKGLVLTTPWNDYGFDVAGEAANGREGLELAIRIMPDLVITDIRMPQMDGLALIRELSRRINAEYLIISGFNEFDYAKQAMKLGVKDYLLKPIDDRELEEVLQKLGTEIRQRKQNRKVQDSLALLSESKIMFFKEQFLANEVKVTESYVREAIDFLKKHFREDLNLKIIAAQSGISESYLSRLFKQETGYTFVEYLTNYRISKAIELLKDKTIKVYEVAGLVGYSDSHYFSSLFRKYVGLTPSEFKDGLNR
ncbi:MAG TPA: response regulator [Bacillota bacterium]